MATMKYFDTASQTWKRVASGAMSDGVDQISPSDIKSLRRSQMHSGCVQTPVVTTGDTTNLNSITIPKTDYHINGTFIAMPQTTVTLPAPDTTGTREDLVFLEAYFSTSNPYQLTGRYRTVANVNFNQLPEGLGCWSSSGTWYYPAQPQGGLASPVSSNNWVFFYRHSGNLSMSSSGSETTVDLSGGNFVNFNDRGIYVSGDGSSTSKTTLATYDGYSYAIPLFRVKRRNSSGYSPSNPNGGRGYFQIYFGSQTGFLSTQTKQITLGNITGGDTATIQYSNINVGDSFVHPSNSAYSVKVISKDGGTLVTIQNTGADMNGTNSVFNLKSDRPDNTYANVIDSRDIPQPYDLRHRVQAQFNYDYELKRASDQFMRGEIGTQKKMMKVYHGIPKTTTDINTVFYASLDGTLTPEIGGSGAMNLGTGSFKPMPTGSGYKFNGDSQTPISVSGLDINKGTIDFLIASSDLRGEINDYPNPVSILDSSNSEVFSVVFARSNTTLYFEEVCTDLSITAIGSRYTLTNSSPPYIQIRCSWDISNLYLRVNGNLIGTAARKANSLWKTPTMVQIGGRSNSASCKSKSTISDTHISNIDRGSAFYHLPADFISGDAQIMPAYTNQRRILSEAQMTQTVNGIQKINNASGTSRGLVTSRTTGNWTSGDTIAVTGMAGELISGVFDADTALATIIKDQNTGDTSLAVDIITGLAVNDTFQILDRQLGTLRTTVHTISAIDSTNKILTITPSLTAPISKYQSLVMETTATSSVPKVSFGITGTAQAGASTTITLASGASATDSKYNGLNIYITSGTGAGQNKTITSYVGSTKVATVSSAWTTNPDATSVYAIYGITVNGTWTNLGTNVATFTLGTDATLTTQDVQIDYSTIMPSGQPALTAPTIATLAGEAGIRVTSASLLGNDFNGKISGQTWENPNVAKYKVSGSLDSPSTFGAEFITGSGWNGYSNLAILDGSVTSIATAINTQYAQQLFSFDLIKIVERKLGSKIPGKTTADKVVWLKSNLATTNGLVLKWYGYGSSSLGNKAYIKCYDFNASSWTGLQYTTSGSIALVTDNWGGSIPSRIDSNGFVHFLAYSDPSDGTTPSVIYTDYVSLDIQLSNKIVILYKNIIGTSSSIILRDDFVGKTKGDTTGNPNIIRYKEGAISGLNTNFVPGTGTEIETSTGNYNYSALANLDNTLSYFATSTSGNGAAFIKSWNVISQFESKYGTIQAIDKVAYLKSTLGTIVQNTWTYGSLTSGGNSATVAVWNSVASTWSTVGSNITNVVTKISGGSAIVSIANMIDSNGYVHFMVYSSASDGTASTIYVDYANLELTLASSMYPTGYDILVPDVPRRDGGLSNIMLVGKQTKEVQTLFNWSNEYNLATYSDYLPAPSSIASSTDVTIISELSEWVIVDIGASVGMKWGNHPWSNLAFKVGQDSDSLYGELGSSLLPFSVESMNLNTGSLVNLSATGFNNNFTKQYGLTAISKPIVGIGRWLVMYNSQLYLLVFSKLVTNGVFNTDNSGSAFLINLAGNPLSKLDSGIQRPGVVTPTTFKTPNLVVQGLQDKATLKLITTNNSI